MTPIDPPVSNAVFGAPADLDESQVHPIRGFRFEIRSGNLDGSNAVVVAWRPDEQDIEAINRGDPIFLTCIGGLVPHFLTTQFTVATMGAQSIGGESHV